MWILEKTDSAGPLVYVRNEVIRLLSIFNNKKFIKECVGCGNVATYCTVYGNTVHNPHWFCDECDPYRLGAAQGRLNVLRTYEDSLEHVKFWCDEKYNYKSIIRSMAEAKGLIGSVTKSRAQVFFNTE